MSLRVRTRWTRRFSSTSATSRRSTARVAPSWLVHSNARVEWPSVVTLPLSTSQRNSTIRATPLPWASNSRKKFIFKPSKKSRLTMMPLPLLQKSLPSQTLVLRVFSRTNSRPSLAMWLSKHQDQYTEEGKAGSSNALKTLMARWLLQIVQSAAKRGSERWNSGKVCLLLNKNSLKRLKFPRRKKFQEAGRVVWSVLRLNRWNEMPRNTLFEDPNSRPLGGTALTASLSRTDVRLMASKRSRTTISKNQMTNLMREAPTTYSEAGIM